MRRIIRIKPISLAKMLSVIFALFGLILGIIYSFGGLISEILINSLNSGTALAFLALLGMPIILASTGFILGFVVAWIYNIAAKWFGGIEVEFEK